MVKIQKRTEDWEINFWIKDKWCRETSNTELLGV